MSKVLKIQKKSGLWFEANGFLLNEKKTESLIYSLKSDKPNKYFNMLGIKVDNKLTWEGHID